MHSEWGRICRGAVGVGGGGAYKRGTSYCTQYGFQQGKYTIAPILNHFALKMIQEKHPENDMICITLTLKSLRSNPKRRIMLWLLTIESKETYYVVAAEKTRIFSKKNYHIKIVITINADHYQDKCRASK